MMHDILLTRNRNRKRPGTAFLGSLKLQSARAHEFCGPARRTLALMAAGATQGAVFWNRLEEQPEVLNPEGMLRYMNPEKLFIVSASDPAKLLWAAEQALRCGLISTVIVDLPAPPALTPVRRLHLSAETGAEKGYSAPVCLLLAPGEGGAPGIESRWYMAPRHSRKESHWMLERRRERSKPPAAWEVAMSRSKPVLSEYPAADFRGKAA